MISDLGLEFFSYLGRVGIFVQYMAYAVSEYSPVAGPGIELRSRLSREGSSPIG